jgi:hypothetical protein
MIRQTIAAAIAGLRQPPMRLSGMMAWCPQILVEDLQCAFIYSQLIRNADPRKHLAVKSQQRADGVGCDNIILNFEGFKALEYNMTSDFMSIHTWKHIRLLLGRSACQMLCFQHGRICCSNVLTRYNIRIQHHQMLGLDVVNSHIAKHVHWMSDKRRWSFQSKPFDNT